MMRRREFISRVPGAVQHAAQRSDALQTRDRCTPWRSRISGALLVLCTRAAPHPGHAKSNDARSSRCSAALRREYCWAQLLHRSR